MTQLPPSRTHEYAVKRLVDLGSTSAVVDLFSRFQLTLAIGGDEEDIPGSYWGAPEAGIIGNVLYARSDTPVHSLLHTACHWLCMDDERRAAVHTDAGGNDAEECAVCYLQCLLADKLASYSKELMFSDMDAWGYSFRFGTAKRWFYEDASDACDWLLSRGLISSKDIANYSNK
jgi:hypothetical protein